jgi:hypothetical protein
LEIQKLEEQGKNYQNVELGTNLIVKCLWCKMAIKVRIPHRQQKYCSSECSQAYTVMVRHIYNLYIFDSQNRDFQFAELARLGKNYQLPPREP